MPKVEISDRESVFVIQTVRTALHRGQSVESGSRLLEFIVFAEMCLKYRKWLELELE